MGIGVAALDGVEGADLNGVTGEDIWNGSYWAADGRDGGRSRERWERRLKGEGEEGSTCVDGCCCSGNVKPGMVSTVAMQIWRAGGIICR